MTGRTVIVTGANSGIGRAAAAALAGAGARVVLAVRYAREGRARPPRKMPGQTEVRALDLASLASVREFAAGWDGRDRRADQQRRRDGAAAEPHRGRLRAAVRHQPPRPLRPHQPAARADHRPRGDRLLERAPDRAGSTSTTSTGSAGRYRAWRAYGQSKLANLLFTAELQRRLTEAGSAVLATAAHPGYASTNLQFHSGKRLQDCVSRVGNAPVAQSEEGGALPTLYAAIADVPGNSFAGPAASWGRAAPAKLVGRTSQAKDMDVARRLWEVSEELTGVRFPLGAPVGGQAAPTSGEPRGAPRTGGDPAGARERAPLARTRGAGRCPARGGTAPRVLSSAGPPGAGSRRSPSRRPCA